MTNFHSIKCAIIAALVCSPVFAEIPVFDSHCAFNNLEKQCEFGPRNPGSSGHDQCRQWLVSRLESAGATVYQQRFTGEDKFAKKKHQLTNIIGRFGGIGKPLMLCAHWDTRPRADRDPDPRNRNTPIPGANDGASGVAVLLEIARIISENPTPKPILIVFFDGEDMGRENLSKEYALGSRYWASHQIPEPPKEAILLDMVGDADLLLPYEQFSEWKAPQLRRRLWQIAAELGLTAFIERPGPAVEDDHVPLLEAGIPAVDIIDFDYPYWHTLQDTPDKCTPESLGQVGRLLVKYIYEN